MKPIRTQIQRLAVPVLVGWLATLALAADRPNVVFILLDNLGQEWFGCYGSEENCTPNIDRLARAPFSPS